MKRIILLACASLCICYSCKQQTKTIEVAVTWTDNHFIYSNNNWYAVIAEGSSDSIHSLSFGQTKQLVQGTNATIAFDIENSKAASHTIVIFNDSNADKIFTESDSEYSVKTVAVSTDKEIAIDINVLY